MGDVIVRADPEGSVAIESSSLEAQLGSLLNESGSQRLRETLAGKPFVLPAELEAIGIKVAFDLSRLELSVLSIDPTSRPVQPLQGKSTERENVLPVMKPAGLSAYLNATANLLYRDVGGVAPPEFYLFGATRYKNLVLEYDGGVTDTQRFYRRSLRAVYDEPEKYRRWSAGDLRLENTGFLRTPFLGGVAVEKTRREFDPLSPAVNLGGRQILLTSPSTVEVIVNGASYRTFDLQPGTYSLEDLPIQTGSNDVRLVIRDGSGREQVTRFDYFYDLIDLEAGEDEYTIAAGVSTQQLNLQPHYSNDPVLIASYRRALCDTVVVGGGIQVAKGTQVVAAETQIIPQVIPGSFDLQAAVSTGNGTGVAFRGGYRVQSGTGFRAKRFSASFNYESPNFRTVADLSFFRSENLSINATYSQGITERTSVVAGANYFSRFGKNDQSTVYADVNHRLRPNIRATVGVEYGTGSLFGRNFGVRAAVAVLFGGRHRADASYQSRRNLTRASIARSSTSDVGSFGYSVNLQNSDGGASIDGVADYNANRFEARASIGSSGASFGGLTRNQTARLQIGTSIAFADGVFGIGRPIQDAFLLAHPHKTLTNANVIAGRSLVDGKYEANSGPFGAAVVGRLSSYTPQNVRYDIDTLDAGYDIGSGIARVDPPFHGGYKLLVGSDHFVSAVGFLKIAGEPAELLVGKITSEDDESFEPQQFFTNSVGRFGVVGLSPGKKYLVQLSEDGRSFVIDVPPDNTGLYRLGTVEVPGDTQ